MTSTGPNATPSAPSPVSPSVRTEKSACRGKSSSRIGLCGSAP
jgi:hypothetical protein